MNNNQSFEICGDGGMPVSDRLRYLALNFWRNVVGRGENPKIERFYSGRLPENPAVASPMEY